MPIAEIPDGLGSPEAGGGRMRGTDGGWPTRMARDALAISPGETAGAA